MNDEVSKLINDKDLWRQSFKMRHLGAELVENLALANYVGLYETLNKINKLVDKMYPQIDILIGELADIFERDKQKELEENV